MYKYSFLIALLSFMGWSHSSAQIYDDTYYMYVENPAPNKQKQYNAKSDEYTTQYSYDDYDYYNYDDEDYYYSSQIMRFNRPYSNFNYYSSLYWDPFYSPGWYYPTNYYWSPAMSYYAAPGFYVSFGWNPWFTMGYNSWYGVNYGWNSWYGGGYGWGGNGYYGCGNGYYGGWNNGFCGGGYYGNGYYGGNGNNGHTDNNVVSHYGPRRSMTSYEANSTLSTVPDRASLGQGRNQIVTQNQPNNANPRERVNAVGKVNENITRSDIRSANMDEGTRIGRENTIKQNSSVRNHVKNIIRSGTIETERESVNPSSSNEYTPTTRREPRSQPIREMRSEPVRETRSEPVRETRSQPVRETRSQPVREMRSEPVREMRTEPSRSFSPSSGGSFGGGNSGGGNSGGGGGRR